MIRIIQINTTNTSKVIRLDCMVNGKLMFLTRLSDMKWYISYNQDGKRRVHGKNYNNALQAGKFVVESIRRLRRQK